jgi:hypothetical protein
MEESLRPRHVPSLFNNARCPKLASLELNLVSIEVVSLLIAGRLFLV